MSPGQGLASSTGFMHPVRQDPPRSRPWVVGWSEPSEQRQEQPVGGCAGEGVGASSGASDAAIFRQSTSLVLL
jgi:hypothetical protein